MPAQSSSCSTLSFTFSLQQLNDKLPKNNDQKNKLSVKENGPTLQVFIYIAKKNIKFTFQLLKHQTELFYCLFVLYVFFSWYLLLRCGFNRKPDGPLGISLHKNVIWSVLFGWCLVWCFVLFFFRAVKNCCRRVGLTGGGSEEEYKSFFLMKSSLERVEHYVFLHVTLG